MTPYYHKNLFSSKKISPVYYTVLDRFIDLLSRRKGINMYIYIRTEIHLVYDSPPPTFIFQTLQERVYNNKTITIIIIIKIKKKAGERQREGYIPNY